MKSNANPLLCLQFSDWFSWRINALQINWKVLCEHNQVSFHLSKNQKQKLICARNKQNPLKFPWNSRMEFPWIYRVEFPWISRGEFPWIFRVEFPWISREEFPWNSREEFPWISKGEFPWTSMNFQGIISMNFQGGISMNFQGGISTSAPRHYSGTIEGTPETALHITIV